MAYDAEYEARTAEANAKVVKIVEANMMSSG
jgi:hypothetical protein